MKFPIVKSEMDRATPEEGEVYDKFDDLSFGNPLPWQQGPRRMGTDKNADVLWVGNSWGGSLGRIDTRTLETTIVPLPEPTMQPYHLAVDKNHNVWGNLWTNDQIFKYDPATVQVDDLRAAGARHGDPPHRARRAQRQDAGDPAGLPHQPDGRDDGA